MELYSVCYFLVKLGTLNGNNDKEQLISFEISWMQIKDFKTCLLLFACCQQHCLADGFRDDLIATLYH